MSTETVIARKERKEEVGIVISDKMAKTLVVEVTRKIRHKKYGKVINRRKKYYAHDENNTASTGDKVSITESRPLSKLKRWTLKAVITKAKLSGTASEAVEEALGHSEGLKKL